MICANCGREVPNNFVVISGSNSFCAECAAAFNTCAMCKHGAQCEFVQNPDPMPQSILQTVRKGNMTMQTEVKNPARIEKFCKECQCYNEEFVCYKQCGTCKNYEEREW